MWCAHPLSPDPRPNVKKTKTTGKSPGIFVGESGVRLHAVEAAGLRVRGSALAPACVCGTASCSVGVWVCGCVGVCVRAFVCVRAHRARESCGAGPRGRRAAVARGGGQPRGWTQTWCAGRRRGALPGAARPVAARDGHRPSRANQAPLRRARQDPRGLAEGRASPARAGVRCLCACLCAAARRGYGR